MTASPPSDELLRVQRHTERATGDRDVIDAILDAGFLCHLGYVRDGRPVVIPTLYGRDGDDLVLHGSTGAGSLRSGGAGLPVCVTVTLVDGLVLARSTFNSSANYRSVVVHGEAKAVEDRDDKLAALAVLSNHVAVGRWAEARQPTARELAATAVLRLPLTHAVAKVRDGGVGDDGDDRALPIWAGVIPIATVLGPAQLDEGVSQDAPPPAVLAAATPSTGAPAAPR